MRAATPSASPSATGRELTGTDRQSGRPLVATWLGRVPYREAWELQHRLVEARAADEIPDQLLLLEHPAVLTLGRNAEERHVLAPPELLAERGIEVIRVERGGEVTYHGPGQLVAYPIVKLESRGLLLRPLVRALESALVETCAAFGVVADRRDGHPGCWVAPESVRPRKIGALGIRVERGVSYHGIALNVSVDLADFTLIDPCGMVDVVSTSIAKEAGWLPLPPSTEDVDRAAEIFTPALARAFGAALEWATVGTLPVEPPPSVRPARKAATGSWPSRRSSEGRSTADRAR